MYLAQVSRPSAPGGAPVSMAGLEEYLPEQLRSMVPTDPVKIFIYGAIGLLVVATLFSGGVSTGRRRR